MAARMSFRWSCVLYSQHKVVTGSALSHKVAIAQQFGSETQRENTHKIKERIRLEHTRRYSDAKIPACKARSQGVISHGSDNECDDEEENSVV